MKHHIKTTLLSALFALCITSNVFATATGIKIEGSPGLLINDSNVKLDRLTGKFIGNMKFGRIPISTGLGIAFGKNADEFSYGIAGFIDYYVLDIQLKNTWNLFSGFGAEGDLLTKNLYDWKASFGAKFFIGMNWLLYDNYLELYVQQNVVPTYVKDLNESGLKGDFILSLPLEYGIRMHF